jgi:hypothetical protein
MTHRIDIEEAWEEFVSMKALVDPKDADDFLAVLYAWRDEAVTDKVREIEDPDAVHVHMSIMDARFSVRDLRFLVDREDAVTSDHAAANLSARWLADQIESAMPTSEGQTDA